MPRTAADVSANAYLRLFNMGTAKVGKSCTVVKSIPLEDDQKVYVINSDDENSLHPVLDFTTNFDWDLVLGTNLQDIENAIATARKGVASGEYGAVVWDTITKYCFRVEQVFGLRSANKDGEWDGRRYFPQLQRHIHGIIDRLFMLPCHIVVNSHWSDWSGPPLDGQLRQKGEGIAPALPGKLRGSIPAEFQDVVFLEKNPTTGAREFITAASGVWGPGCRNLKDKGITVLPGDVSVLWENMHHGPKSKETK